MYRYLKVLPYKSTNIGTSSRGNPNLKYFKGDFRETILDTDYLTYLKLVRDSKEGFLDQFLLCTCTSTSFKRVLPKTLNTYLINLSSLELDRIFELDIFKGTPKQEVYIDFYIDKVTKESLDILKEYLQVINKLDIRVCYTYNTDEDRILWDDLIHPLFDKYINFYRFQKIITNRNTTGVCQPKAIELDLDNGNITLDCKRNELIGNIRDGDLDETFSTIFECKEKFCESGDAINKENNWANFYAPVIRGIRRRG